MLNQDAPLPAGFAHQLPSKNAVCAHQASRLSGPRWAAAIRDAGLPAPTGPMDTDGLFSLTRGEIFDFAAGEITEDNSLQLLYRSLAWGLGSKGFRMTSKMRGIGETETSQLASILMEAWASVQGEGTPQECYETLLTPKGRPRIKQLGAAFATKYLYFAAGHQDPRTPILDSVVARALRPHAWEGSPTTAWWSSTYASYCRLLTNWAHKASEETGEHVRLDQVEKLLFSQ